VALVNCLTRASGASEGLVLQADFSGSWDVTSRNPLIHNGATTATKLERFDVEGVPRDLWSRAAAVPDGPFATVNFREFLFFPRTPVNKGKK
jgi:hypothetical protein